MHFGCLAVSLAVNPLRMQMTVGGSNLHSQ